MVKRIILLRHGERSDLAIGPDRIDHDIPYDAPLTNNGQTQAHMACNYLFALLPQTSIKLVSSPLLRCVQTLAPLAKAINLPIHMQNLFGEAFQEEFSHPYSNLYVKHHKNEFPIDVKLIDEQPLHTSECVESLDMTTERIKGGIFRYFEKTEEEVLVICTHLYVIWAHLITIGVEVEYDVSYAQIAELEYKEGRLSVLRQAVKPELQENNRAKL